MGLFPLCLVYLSFWECGVIIGKCIAGTAAPGNCNGRGWKNVSFMTLWDVSKYHTVEELSWRTSEILVMEELSTDAALGVTMDP